ncbi:MAG: hypothetical protein LBU56_01235 [Rickettsiales bacterium]|jgi:hypothetical protein|nr:hypothetical protein [Rickettsiales bacterium]
MSPEQRNLDSKQSSTFMGTLQDKLKNIKNFSNWSAKEQMVAVSAVGMVFGALLPVVAVALPVAAAGAAVALTLFFAVKAVEYAFTGLKWSAEKTWEGAKRIGEQIERVAVHAGNAVKKGYKCSVDSLEREAHLVRDRITDARNVLAVAIYDDREKYEDRSEVKESAAKKREDYILKSSREMRSNMFYGDDTSSLSRSSSISSLNSDRTVDSTVGLLNPEEHKEAPTSLWNRFPSPFKSGKKSEQTSEIKYQPLPKLDAMPSAEIGNSRFYVAPQKPPRSNLPSPVAQDASQEISNNDRSSRNKVIIGKYLEEAEKKQQRPSTSRSDSPDSGRSSPNSFGSATPIGIPDLLLGEAFNRKLERRLKLRASLEQPSAEPFNSRTTAPLGKV